MPRDVTSRPLTTSLAATNIRIDPTTPDPDTPRWSSAAPSAALLHPEQVPPPQNYAVVWSSGDETRTGRLEIHREWIQLRGRNAVLRLPFADVQAASIERGSDDRLRGFPVLALRGAGDSRLRVASLQGTGAFHEVIRQIESAGLTVAA